MPYISPLIRPIFDKIYIEATYVGTRTDTSTTLVCEKVRKALDFFPIEQRDGCLNYFLTKILLYLKDRRIVEEILRQLFVNEFFVEPSYFKLERATGLVSCLIAEFKQREEDWETPNFVKYLLDDFACRVEISRQMYEKKKRRENGDMI